MTAFGIRLLVIRSEYADRAGLGLGALFTLSAVKSRAKVMALSQSPRKAVALYRMPPSRAIVLDRARASSNSISPCTRLSLQSLLISPALHVARLVCLRQPRQPWCPVQRPNWRFHTASIAFSPACCACWTAEAQIP
jgi:hypothetical protein